MKFKKITSFGLLLAFCAAFALPVQAADKKIKILNEDFEAYEVGTKLSEAGLGWTVTDSSEGDSITIEEDPVSKSKAVKLKQKFYEKAQTGNPTTGFEIPLEKINDGIIDISFKIRSDSWNSRFCNQGFVFDSDGRNVIGVKQYGGGLYDENMGYLTALSATEYKEVKITCDFTGETKKASVTIGNKTVTKDTVTAVNVDKLRFNINANWNGLAVGWIEQKDTSDPVYWIDDISVMRRGLSVTGASISDGAENAAVDRSVVISFDKEINTEKVAKNLNVNVLKNSEKTDAYEILAEGKTITVTPSGGFEYNTDYTITLEQIEAKEKGNLPVDAYTLSFRTERLFDKISGLSENGRYSTKKITLPQKDNVTIKATLENSAGESSEFVSGTEITIPNEYTLTVVGENNLNGKKQTDIYRFSVVGEQPPEAKNVKITLQEARLLPNSVLTGSYEFYDVNDDGEGETILRWYSAENPNASVSEYKLLSENKKSEGVSQYTLTENELNKYIIFSVKAVSIKEPYEGAESFSDVFTGFFVPAAESVTVKGSSALGETLSAEYKYTDKNDDSDITAEYQWYRCVDDGEAKAIDGANGISYTLSEKDVDCTLKVGVRLKKYGSTDSPWVYSEEIAGLYSPKVSDVKLKGTAKPGQSLYVEYVFSDKNNDKEGETVITWYEDGKAVSSGESLTITKNMAGSSIAAEVKPVSENYPFEGAAVKSDAVTVSKTVVSGGGGGSAAPSIPVNTQKPVEKEEEKAPAKNDEKKEFSDISGHWAEKIIKEMYEKGFINGISEDKFAPDNKITRAQLAAMAVKMFEIPYGEKAYSYSDVKEDAWYAEAVGKMSSNGLMSGYNGKFLPDDYITRRELAVVIMNLAKHFEIYEKPTAAAEFSDSEDIAEWAAEAVDYAYSAGIVLGKSDGRFAPLDSATRAEGITMMKRLSERIGGNADEE